jgi:glycosyltransferase involved in cell wall biosynthesis
MKIVQLVTQMEAGGAQRVAMLLGDALRQQGYDAEVWFLYLKRPTYQDLPGVRVILDRQPAILDYVQIGVKLQKMLKQHQPDILITHTHYANIMGQVIARFCGVPRRVAVQHNPVETYPQIAMWLDKILGSTDFYTANIAVSQVVVDSVINYPAKYQKCLQKIYNGIPTLTRQHSLDGVRSRWNLPAQVPLLINVGRLARQKNHRTLIESLQSIPIAHLILIGEGELRADLEQQVARLDLGQRVHFLGEMKSADVLDLLCIADVFVFPSLYEAMPMALVEAMGLGLPIVGGDIPAMREVLSDAGLLVASENAAEIASAVGRVLADPDFASNLRQSSFQRSALFSVEKMVAAYERLFN